MTSSSEFDFAKFVKRTDSPRGSVWNKAASLLVIRNPVLPRFALYSVALFGSFFFTLWLTEPPKPWVDRSDRAKLLAQKIGSAQDINRAAENAGFRLSGDLRGSIDSIKRNDAGDVTMVGWLADKEGYAVSLEVLVFTRDGKTASTRTAGERADVTRQLSLGFGAEKNVSFQLTFACAPGEQPLVIGLGTKGQYTRLVASRCP
jgi:hypothetical protein